MVSRRNKSSRLVAVLLVAAGMVCASCAHSGYVAVSHGGRIYYEERGKGEPLLLLHGHSLDGRMWDGQFRTFARRYRTVRMDFRGYGRSSEQREDMPMTHVDDVLALMDSLHLPKAHVVGLSMGAFVAGDMLGMYPERLLSCVMASGGIRRGSKGPSEPMDSDESKRRDAEIAALKQKGVPAMKSEWIESLIASGGSRRESMRPALTRMITEWSAWQPLHKEVRLFYGKEAWARLQQVRPMVPTLMLGGAAEGKKGEPAELRYLPQGRHVVLADCGHMMNMEQPAEFNSTVMQFLDSIGRTAR